MALLHGASDNLAVCCVSCSTLQGFTDGVMTVGPHAGRKVRGIGACGNATVQCQA
jgi:hypothetical protein